MRLSIGFTLLFGIVYGKNVEKTYCGKGEVWTDGCVPPCPETCPPQIVKPCPKMCRLGGCICRAGYVRDQYRSNTCVPKEKCSGDVLTTASPQACPENEQSSDCAAPAVCQALCPNSPPSGMVCTQDCRHGCVCKPGHYRDPRKNMKCIEKQQC